VPLPGLSPSSSGLVVPVTLVETSALFSSSSKPPALSVLLNRLDDPVDLGITANSLMLRVDEDNLKVLVGGILVDPVGVENTQVCTAAADTLLGSGLEGALVLELVHTLVGGLAICGSFGDRPLATSTADTDAVDDVSLLGLVSEAAGLVRARGAGGTVADLQVPQLPTPNTEQKSEDIRLLLLVKFLNVLKGTHLCWLVVG